MTRKRINIGSVISGTLRSEDLVPAFIDELRAQRPLSRSIRRTLRSIEGAARRAGYFDTVDASEDCNTLIDLLSEFAPEGFYFGSHPGDGADFGFWLDDYFVEDFEGLRVDDLADVPRAHTGTVLHVNDHGNISLYRYTRGRARELWAIV